MIRYASACCQCENGSDGVEEERKNLNCMNFKKIRWSSLVWQTVLIFALFLTKILFVAQRSFVAGQENINNKNFTWKDESEK